MSSPMILKIDTGYTKICICGNRHACRSNLIGINRNLVITQNCSKCRERQRMKLVQQEVKNGNKT